MLSPTTEIRTYVGQPGTRAVDGYAGFVIGQQYALNYERFGSRIFIECTSGGVATGGVVVSEAEFAAWWVG